MIFLGDIAHPFGTAPDWSALTDAIPSQPAVVNLEGALTGELHWADEHRLFNHRSVLEALKGIDTRVASIANNHICDLPDGVFDTREELTAVGILPVGAGRDLEEASAVAEIEHAGRTYIFVAFGWTTIRCIPAGFARQGTQPFEPNRVVERVSELRKANPDAVLIPLFHWNFELEPHPQPAHRQVAFAAIDAGADAVIGHHPHCVGGFEFHRGRLVAYSVGNWWLPQGVFFGGKLSFPDYTLKQVALEWSPDRPARAHWFLYDRHDHAIRFEGTDELSSATGPSALTPYVGYSSRDYFDWFAANRLKSKALPIYTDPNARLINSIYDKYIQGRHLAVIAIKKLTGAL